MDGRAGIGLLTKCYWLKIDVTIIKSDQEPVSSGMRVTLALLFIVRG
jgi:hypothetical protein